MDLLFILYFLDDIDSWTHHGFLLAVLDPEYGCIKESRSSWLLWSLRNYRLTDLHGLNILWNDGRLLDRYPCAGYPGVHLIVWWDVPGFISTHDCPRKLPHNLVQNGPLTFTLDWIHQWWYLRLPLHEGHDNRWKMGQSGLGTLVTQSCALMVVHYFCFDTVQWLCCMTL